MEKQTAVEFAVEKLEKLIPSGNQLLIGIILNQAKEIEKQQQGYSEEDLRLAWEDGREFDYDHNGGEGGEFTGAESFDKWFENLKKKTQ